MSSELLSELDRQYKNFSSRSYRLHDDNLVALVEEWSELGDTPSYSTVQRRMKERRWFKKSSPRNKTKGQKQAAERLERLEVRSYDASQLFCNLLIGQIQPHVVEAGDPDFERLMVPGKNCAGKVI